MTKTKTVTVTATLTWQGTGTAPSRVLVLESAAASWHGTLVGPASSAPNQNEPLPPDGTATGSASTGLGSGNEKRVDDPDPQTATQKGQIVTGERRSTVTVPASGVCVLPSVTLTATAITSVATGTVGTAAVALSSYSVAIVSGAAHASASYNMVPDADSDWTTGRIVYYGDKPSGVFSGQSMGFPKIALDLNNGMTGYYTVSVEAQQFLQTTVADPGLCRLYGSQSVEGYVSNGSFAASSEIVGTDIIGEAPNDDGLTYSKEQSFTHVNSNPAALGGRSSNTPSPGWTIINRVTLKAMVRIQ